jgi:hypothetical protein
MTSIESSAAPISLIQDGHKLHGTDFWAATAFKMYRCLLSTAFDMNTTLDDQILCHDLQDPDHPEVAAVFESLVDHIAGNGWSPSVVWCMTESGRLCRAAEGVQVGDFVTVLYGGAYLYILRSCANQFNLVGDAYIHGLMEREAVDDSNIYS